MANHLKFKGACQQLRVNHDLGELFNSLGQKRSFSRFTMNGCFRGQSRRGLTTPQQALELAGTSWSGLYQTFRKLPERLYPAGP